MSDGTFRCSRWARLLPYVLATGILSSGMILAGQLPPDLSASRGFRALLTVTGGAAALWVLRKGAETRQRVRLAGKTLEMAYGARRRSLELEDIEHVDYAGAFSRGRNWLPATILIDREGLEWRLCALLEGGETLVASIGEIAGRDDLVSWIEARGVLPSMRAVRRRLIFGYGLALGLPIVMALYGLSG